MRNALWIGVLVALVAGCSCSSDRPRDMAPLSERELAELPAAGYKELDDLLKAQKGKVTLMLVWSLRRDACPPLYKKLAAMADPEPAVVAVNIDRVDDVRKEIIPLVKGQQGKCLNRVFRGAPEELAGLVDNNWGGQVPAIVLFDRTGTKAANFSGDDAWEKAEPKLKEMLAEPKQ